MEEKKKTHIGWAWIDKLDQWQPVLSASKVIRGKHKGKLRAVYGYQQKKAVIQRLIPVENF